MPIWQMWLPTRSAAFAGFTFIICGKFGKNHHRPAVHSSESAAAGSELTAKHIWGDRLNAGDI
jgi:hypothetical protein